MKKGDVYIDLLDGGVWTIVEEAGDYVKFRNEYGLTWNYSKDTVEKEIKKKMLRRCVKSMLRKVLDEV